MLDVLVTGGAGFVGSHVVEALLARGERVAVVDDLSRGKRRHLPASVALCTAPLESADARTWIGAQRPRAIVHLAAQIDVGASLQDPVGDAEANVLGTVSVLQAALEAGSKALVFASSGGALYGDAKELPSTESTPAEPLSPYGVSKLCSEAYLDWALRCTELRSVALRFGNVFGPRQNHGGEAGVVSIFADRFMQHKDVCIYGDGTQTRDFIDVQSVASAVLLALDTKAARGAYNISGGKPITITHLAQTLQRLTSTLGTIHYAQAKPGEVKHSLLACGRAQRELGWLPRGSLEDALARYVAGLQSQHVSGQVQATPGNHLAVQSIGTAGKGSQERDVRDLNGP